MLTASSSFLRWIRRVTATGLLAAAAATAETRLPEYYQVEDVALPADIPPEVGGMAFDADGRLYVVLRRGDVLTAMPNRDPAAYPWRVFATGFDNGLGLDVPEPGRIRVIQMAELTEATDTDGDGVADRYRNLASDWGLSGNYHETSSMCSDGQGGYYIALGTASHRSPTFVHTKGEYSAFGRRGRNYSAVEYRGWILHYRADGTIEPYASGFRMHNGLLLDDEGRLWTSDNQGDWKATTPLYRIEKGNFYGHPSSLVWDAAWPEGLDPLALFRRDLDAYNQRRTHAAIEIPHLEMVRSGAEPIQIPREGEFGPFGGQILLPDASGTRIARLMVEEVEGQTQGAVTHFIEGHGLRISNNRALFSPDRRTLYIGQTARGWGASKGTNTEGLQRIRWKGKVPFTVEQMRITPTGFRLTFTAPINAALRQAASYAVRSMTYQSRWTYGSEPDDVRQEAVVVRALDDRTVEVNLDALHAGRVYHLSLAPDTTAASGEGLAQSQYYYTVRRVPREPPPRGGG